MNTKHTFVICAYKESRYLEDCICSLLNQSVTSEIILVTATPCEFISRICTKYDIKQIINTGQSGITQDWNFALEQAKTEFATIAHQDDVYETDYTKELLRKMQESRDSIIAFCDYSELRKGKKVYKNRLLNTKRLMLIPLRAKVFWNSRFIRRRCLSMGDPICCPSVMFNLKQVKLPVFRNGFKSCEDWEAWEKISRQKGKFIYIHKPLMSHRIHQESATTAVLQDDTRVKENFDMYCKFWPKFIARSINRFYTSSEKSNKLE